MGRGRDLRSRGVRLPPDKCRYVVQAPFFAASPIHNYQRVCRAVIAPLKSLNGALPCHVCPTAKLDANGVFSRTISPFFDTAPFRNYQQVFHRKTRADGNSSISVKLRFLPSALIRVCAPLGSECAPRPDQGVRPARIRVCSSLGSRRSFRADRGARPPHQPARCRSIPVRRCVHTVKACVCNGRFNSL